MAPTDTDSCSSLKTQELLSRAQQGHASALNEVYSRYRALLLVEIRARRSISLAEATEAEDVLHMAFVSVFKDLHRVAYKGPGTFMMWLRRVVVNQTLDLMRREAEKPLKKHSIDSALDLPPFYGKRRHQPSEEVSHSESMEKLLDRLRGMPPEDHDLIVLKILDEKTFVDIGKILNLPPGRVARRYAAILKRLRT